MTPDASPGGRRPPHRAAAARLPRRAAVNVLELNLDLDGLLPMTTDPERDAFDVRPTGDEMLARVRAEADGRRAAGCASTSAWRPASARRTACSRRAIAGASAGTDVVVGFVEAHGRPHTARAARRPRDRARAGGSSTAASSSRRWTPTPSSRARRRSPSIDELAHTNVPGSARAKRWEDVEVIRDAGIHVVTT